MMLSEQAKGMLGMTTVIPCDNKYVLNQRIAALTYTDDYNGSFLSRAINNKQAYFEQMGAGTKVQNITKGNVENCLLKLPKLEEQMMIGKYLDNLDNLITLHQRKVKLLKQLKQAYLQQMFPKKDEKFPPLRFANFSEEWEQRKAADIAEYSKGNRYSKSDLTEIGIPIILYGRLYTKYQFIIDDVDTFSMVKNGAVFSKGNEVIIPASGETAGDIARAAAVVKSGILLGGDLNVMRPFDCINPLFLALAISNGEPQKELVKKAQGKSVVHIHNSDIQEVRVSYPTKQEQDQIVAVFRNLDQLITLHQKKNDGLKKIKSIYLKSIFI